MRNLTKLIAAAALGAGALAVTATTASAAIVCNGHGECWHVKRAYAYKPEFGVVVHPNNWRWAAHEKYVWREHTGRGYWRNGVWIRF
ncbi:MAG: hypothetical protein JO056_12505 [Alphaproteobacteria bacterium]|nr:hypothetical protein [Alphaproteobacteria bacterium]